MFSLPDHLRLDPAALRALALYRTEDYARAGVAIAAR